MTDRGHASAEFALAVGLMLLPVVVVLLAFAPWLESRMSVESLAAEAARALVVTRDPEAGARFVATMEHSNNDVELRVGWCGAMPSAHSSSGSCLRSRGARVEVVVSAWSPLFHTPWGDVGGLWVTGSHVEWADPFRSLEES